MKKCEKCDFFRGKEPIQSHLSWKIGPLHIFFITFMDTAEDYLYIGEVRKKFKVGHNFLFMKKFEKVTFFRGKEPIQSPLTLKSRSATYIFYYFYGYSWKNIYTLEKLEKNLK